MTLAVLMIRQHRGVQADPGGNPDLRRAFCSQELFEILDTLQDAD